MGLLVLTVLFCLPMALMAEEASAALKGEWSDFWVTRLTLNLMGYASIFVPGYILIRYLRNIKYNEIADTSSALKYCPGCMQNFIVLCVFGKDSPKPSVEEGGVKSSSSTLEKEETFSKRATKLLFCVAGLQVSYLTWGILQERIMTIEYGGIGEAQGEYFKNSQFLVFVNRILAFIMALLVIFFRKQPQHTAPLYKYSFSSFSNIMSSWCQYEALKFVSFPTQVMAKASKVIPVMLMGKLISGKKYEYYEYVTAVMISAGLSMFLMTSGDTSKHTDTATTTSGIIMLIGYMMFDSFTSNWQGSLFTQYKMSSIQMMAGVNLFSCLLTSMSLIEQGGFFDSSAFMLRHPDFMMDAIILSICSASGQLFIFYTISQYGPVIFVIIMTVRQGCAILLSCIIYGHPVSVIGFFGILVLFCALFLRIYANHKARAQKRAAAVVSTSNLVENSPKV